jgi:hypothetical protein
MVPFASFWTRSKVAGAAALVAVLVALAEISIQFLPGVAQATQRTATVADWFALLRNNCLLGLRNLGLLNLIGAVVLTPTFLGMYFALRRENEPWAGVGSGPLRYRDGDQCRGQPSLCDAFLQPPIRRSRHTARMSRSNTPGPLYVDPDALPNARFFEAPAASPASCRRDRRVKRSSQFDPDQGCRGGEAASKYERNVIMF